MKKENLNKFAKELCLDEGLKKQVNIAQMKEIIGAVGRASRSRGFLGSLMLWFTIHSRAGKK